MEIWQQALLIGLVLGGLLAILIVPRSLRSEAVRGGGGAKFFHAVGAILASAVFPTAVVALILRGGFGVAFPLAFGLAILAFVALIGYAVFEQPAHVSGKSEEEVWTAEKAKTSGL
ncbi:MAG: hypothetical protein L6Q98_06400 [Anaerolineae bacterium]|nr:hypothetical protein [Anaerolineae bacterium]NUQ02813.1 hypothetical protein [Anaerolineae bacterium]